MKYRKKPVVVDAIRWFPGTTVDGVRTRELEIQYSRDGRYYYVTKGNLSATNWLSVEAFDGPVPDDKQSPGFFEKSYVQFSPKSGPRGGTTYHREILPFAVFDVKAGESSPLSENDILFMDYGCVEKWTNTALLPPQEGWIDTLEGTMKVSPGDWIITGVKGEKYPCKPDIFNETYEAVE